MVSPESAPPGRSRARIVLDEPCDPLEHPGHPAGVVAGGGVEDREIGDHALQEREDAARLGLVHVLDGEDLVEQLRVRHVVAAEALDRLVGGLLGPVARRAAVGQDEVALPCRLHSECVLEQPCVRRRDHEGNAPLDADAGPRLARDATGQAGPSELANHLPQERRAERQLGGAESLQAGGLPALLRSEIQDVEVRRRAVLEVGPEEIDRRVPDQLPRQRRGRPGPGPVEQAGGEPAHDPCGAPTEQRQDRVR